MGVGHKDYQKSITKSAELGLLKTSSSNSKLITKGQQILIYLRDLAGVASDTYFFKPADIHYGLGKPLTYPSTANACTSKTAVPHRIFD